MEGKIKIRPTPILFRHLNGLQWPIDSDSGVIKSETSLLLRRVKRTHKIKCLGFVGKSNKAMGESLRHIHHTPVFGG